MKEEWLFPNAIVPVDMETTAALVAEIKRLIDVVGGMALAQPKQEPVVFNTLASLKHKKTVGPIERAMLNTTPPQRTMKSKTPEPLYRQTVPVEDQGKVAASKYYRVNQNMDGLGHSRHPYLIECNIRIDFGVDGGIYKVEWTNKVLEKNT